METWEIGEKSMDDKQKNDISKENDKFVSENEQAINNTYQIPNKSVVPYRADIFLSKADKDGNNDEKRQVERPPLPKANVLSEINEMFELRSAKKPSKKSK